MYAEWVSIHLISVDVDESSDHLISSLIPVIALRNPAYDETPPQPDVHETLNPVPHTNSTPPPVIHSA